MSESPLKIDIHTHILPAPELLENLNQKFNTHGFLYFEDSAEAGCARMMQNGKFFRQVKQNCWCAATRLQECDEASIDVQVLSTVPVMFSYWADAKHTLYLAQHINDQIANIVSQHPKRFIGLGTLPMQSPDLAIDELRRAKALGLRGIEIGSHIDTATEKWNLNHASVFAVLEAASDLDMAVFVHPWDMMGQAEMPDFWLPWLVGMPAESSRAICSLLFGGVFDRLPNLRVAFAHGGGSFPATLGRVAQGFQVRPDLCAPTGVRHPKEYCGHFWVDSLVHDEHMLNYLIELFGSKRIALGTDYPFPLGEFEPKPGGAWCPGSLIARLPESTQTDLYAGAACEWLGIEREQFLR